jgi:hypothetical protein
MPMVPLAPRYDPVIAELVRRLDDPTEPIAEIVRRVAEGAELLGHFRPSYSHLRRYVHDERDRRDAEAARRAAIRDVVEDVALRVLTGRMVNPYIVADRLAEAGKKRTGRTGLWL